MKTARQFIQHTIMAHEGGLSLDRDDTGNWYKGRLIGSKFGVTGAALAQYRGHEISAQDMAALTEDEAVSIAFSAYYDRPQIDLLVWNPVTASILDMGYNAGPGMTAKLVQRMIGVADDGKIGNYTATAYRQFVDDHGIENAAREWTAQRVGYYDQIIRIRPTNKKYRKGWRARADSFLPNSSWWNWFVQ